MTREIIILGGKYQNMEKPPKHQKRLGLQRQVPTH